MRRDSPRYGSFPKRRKSRERPWNRASPAFGKLWEHAGKCRVDLKKLAKYKVQDVKEEDGVYTVSVQVEPSNVFQTLQQSSTEVSNEKIKQGLDGNDPEVFASVLTESVQKSLEKNSYGKAVTVKVSVEKDNSGKYGLSDTEMSKLEAAMFPTE